MQISTKLFNQQTLERLSELHGEIQNRQARIATGKDLLKASDNPIAAVNISVAKEQKQELARYLDNIDRAKNKLELTEGAMEQTYVPKCYKLYNQFLAFSMALYQDSRELILVSLLIFGFQVFDDVI